MATEIVSHDFIPQDILAFAAAHGWDIYQGDVLFSVEPINNSLVMHDQWLRCRNGRLYVQSRLLTRIDASGDYWPQLEADSEPITVAQAWSLVQGWAEIDRALVLLHRRQAVARDLNND